MTKTLDNIDCHAYLLLLEDPSRLGYAKGVKLILVQC